MMRFDKIVSIHVNHGDLWYDRINSWGNIIRRKFIPLNFASSELDLKLDFESEDSGEDNNNEPINFR